MPRNMPLLTLKTAKLLKARNPYDAFTSATQPPGTTKVVNPTPATPPGIGMAVAPHPIAPTSPVQRFTGRVGGNLTTAQLTQPLSALLSWFTAGGRQGSPKMQMITDWLNQYLPAASNSKSEQPWKRSLPQNITNELLRRLW